MKAPKNWIKIEDTKYEVKWRHKNGLVVKIFCLPFISKRWSFVSSDWDRYAKWPHFNSKQSAVKHAIKHMETYDKYFGN